MTKKQEKKVILGLIKDDLLHNHPSLTKSTMVSKTEDGFTLSCNWFLLFCSNNEDGWFLSFRTNITTSRILEICKIVFNYILPENIVYYEDFYVDVESQQIIFGEDAHTAEKIAIHKKNGNYVCYNCQLYFSEAYMNKSKTFCVLCDKDNSIVFC